MFRVYADKLRFKVSRFKRLAISLMVAAAAVAAFASAGHKTPQDSEPKQPKASLTVAVVKPATLPLSQRISANGDVVAWQESIIGTNLGNLRLTDVRANVGDRVKKGQVLATFADEEIRILIAQGQASVAEAAALHQDAQENLARVQALGDNGALSKQQITFAVTQEGSSAARVQLAQARLAAELLRLKQTLIVAPDDGVISARSVAVGTICQAGQELFRMVRQGRMEWHAEVTANDSATIHPDVAVSVFAPGGVVVTGKVRKVAPTVDTRSRNVLVYIDLPNDEAHSQYLKPGMFVAGEIPVGNSEALMVPGSALVLRDGLSSVFVIDGQDVARQVRVRPGREEGAMIEVEGVPPNALVVSKGAGFLADGDLVRVEN
ncbi:efflux RND transporter periplasmic adaptor subunit [Pseudomonas sp. H3(2019)]|uniref:efflux RND transporter periplasmic adaptor subunit n=1 Tax=Pseudomonas sp. H3(2019) TaxID=2598724 RepID=UPI0011933656|nr:efflux RND transporter periplasmic adaptor subunit [Pseudomonas sp. H3(2019)]TVT86084.1 efflux RND transporter periplasmic adaptor subunit [Pseudomonas sp. H3(2019)]